MAKILTFWITFIWKWKSARDLRWLNVVKVKSPTCATWKWKYCRSKWKYSSKAQVSQTVLKGELLLFPLNPVTFSFFWCYFQNVCGHFHGNKVIIGENNTSKQYLRPVDAELHVKYSSGPVQSSSARTEPGCRRSVNTGRGRVFCCCW